MKINESALLNTLEMSLTGFLPLPEYFETHSSSIESEFTLGPLRHGQLLNWRQAVEATGLPGFGQSWVLVPLRGGRVVLACRERLTAHQRLVAETWHLKVLPVLAALTDMPGNQEKA